MKKIKLILIGAGQLGLVSIIKKDRKYEVVGFITLLKKLKN